MPRIAVGVDGSEGSRQALLWAVNEATLRGASLDVVYSYEHHPRSLIHGRDESLSAAQVEAIREDRESASREAAEHAQSLVDRILDDLEAPSLEGRAVESSNPAETLVELSKGADMLVVGSRGRGGFRSLVLGSVSQQCAQHAECPVVIIR